MIQVPTKKCEMFSLYATMFSRSYFSNQLSSAIQFCSFSPLVHKGHSFRIGAASHAANKRLSDAQVRLDGSLMPFKSILECLLCS